MISGRGGRSIWRDVPRRRPRRGGRAPAASRLVEAGLQLSVCQALFGDDARDDPEGSLPDWQYHLRELAALGVEDERLAYLNGISAAYREA